MAYTEAEEFESLRSAPERNGVQAPPRPNGTALSTPTGREPLAFFGQYQHLFRYSESMRQLERVVSQVADTTATVLIQGETGVGKELVAKACHYLSSRARRPFLKVTCAALPPELLESELFGHEKGAFTGATDRKPGRFELANGGTLFLDEIGEMPLRLQPKLLNVLQDSEFFRVGGRELLTVDVRIIAATNRNLAEMVAKKRFREDLYYRLNVVNLAVAPLRERREEIPFLVEYFCKRFSDQFNRPKPALSDETIALLLAHPWPGNLRELENLIKQWVVLQDEAHLRKEIEERLRAHEVARPGAAKLREQRVRLDLKGIGRRAAREAELEVLKDTLERVRWNRAEAARVLNVSYKTLLHKLRDANITGRRRSDRLAG
jgi:two-component system, NtrC family, response regulator AtoC